MLKSPTMRAGQRVERGQNKLLENDTKISRKVWMNMEEKLIPTAEDPRQMGQKTHVISRESMPELDLGGIAYTEDR